MVEIYLEVNGQTSEIVSLTLKMLEEVSVKWKISEIAKSNEKHLL